MQKRINNDLRVRAAARTRRNSPEWRQMLADARKALGTRVRKLREKKGWTQEEFADKCGIDHSRMSRIECGKDDLTILTIHNLARHLDIDIAELFRGIA